MNYAALINHYLPGAFYPLGGTSEIAFQIVPIIEKYGGRVFVDAPVSQILINDKGKAHGMLILNISSGFSIRGGHGPDLPLEISFGPVENVTIGSFLIAKIWPNPLECLLD